MHGVARKLTIETAVEETQDIYRLSRFAQRLMETSFLSVVDLDGTFAFGSMAARQKVRAILERMGAFVFCTARTPELVMSRRSYNLSKHLAEFSRSEPKWLVSDGIRYDSPLDTLPEDEVDPDAILSFGQGIYIGGNSPAGRPYFHDLQYQKLYLDLPDASWIELMRKILDELGLSETKFENVDQTDYRVQIDFFGENAVEQKYKALRAIKDAVPLAHRGRFEGVDESKPSDDPLLNRSTLYGMPPQARKENMINYLLSQGRRVIRRDLSTISGLIIGDTLTDFYAACYAGWDANMTGIIVGGSRLSACIEEKANFAGVDLRHMHTALEPTSREGFYRFNNPLSRGGWIKSENPRLVVLGEQAYPGTRGAETILAYVEDRHNGVSPLG